jgi:hypothetical protein
MATPERTSAVDIHTYADGQTDIDVTGPGGTLTLSTHINEPTIAIYDPKGGKRAAQAVISLSANGHLRGWLAREGNQLEWFPARKIRGEKPVKKKV